jgi:GNAT superfamily N-acetyltransferase
VTVVRGEPLADGWVVAQLDCDPSAADLLRIAVEEAVLRRMPLRLLTTWPDPEGTPAVEPAELDARLARELEVLANEHSGLDVAVEPNATLERYLGDHASQIALFVAADRQTHDIGTVLHPSAEHALRVLSCPVMLHAGANSRR